MKLWKTAGAILGSAALLGLGIAAAALAGDHPPGGPPTTTGGGHTPVTICHKPGTPAEQTLVVDDDSVELTGHLGHGDTLGPCQTDTTPTETTPTDTTPTDTTPTTPTETTPTTPTETTPTTPSGPRCPPGMTPTAGKDGAPGNDECEFPKTTPPTSTTDATTPVTPPVTPPVTTTTTTTTPTPPAAKPPAKPSSPPKKQVSPKPKPPKPAKPPHHEAKHLCKTLADGTQRRWYKGGNGIKPGCYPIVPGSG